MAVKASRTGLRALRVLEAIASHQPVGVRELARRLDEDKSAIHRAVVTLAEDGWIQPALSENVKWEVSPRILAVADKAYGGLDLKQRARGVLERLRDESGESALLIVPDAKSLIVADVAESTKILRVAPRVGNTVTTERTASGRAILAHCAQERQLDLLSREPDEELLEIYASVRSQGYASSVGETNPGSTSVAAPIIDHDGTPIGAIAIIGPSERIPANMETKYAQMAIHGALTLSRGVAAIPSTR